MNHRSLLAILPFLFLFSCSDSSDTDSREFGLNEGVWRSECTSASLFQFEIDMYQNTYTQSLSFSSTADCSALNNVLEISSSYSLGANGQYMDIDTREIDLSEDNAVATVRKGASFFNQLDLCGKSDWKNGEAVPNIAATCDNWLTFNLFGWDGDLLFIGDSSSGNGTSSASRPTELDLAGLLSPLTRVN